MASRLARRTSTLGGDDEFTDLSAAFSFPGFGVVGGFGPALAALNGIRSCGQNVGAMIEAMENTLRSDMDGERTTF